MATPSESRKRILAISLEGQNRAQAAAMWDGEHVVVVDLHEITGDPDSWLPIMLEDVENKVKAGWVVMVEDRTASLPGNAISFNFDEMAEGGRTQLQTALDWYFTLDGRGAIILGEGMERFAIRRGGEGGLVDCTADEKGRVVYKIDWNRFSAGHKALLMCVVGATMEEPLSDRWLQAMTGYMGGKSKKAISRIEVALWNQYERDRAAFEARKDASEAKRHV